MSNTQSDKLPSSPKVSTSSTVWIMLASIGLFVAHYLAFVFVPMELQMGAAQRIFYFHLPSAWLCYLGFLICAGSSATYLITRKSKHDAFALAAAEVGLIFGAVVLVTGPLWARAAWGVWWKWEPRLTTMAILILIFACYWVMRSVDRQSNEIRVFSSVLSIMGVPTIIFVHIAVTRWRGDHPNNVQLETDMRIALYSCLLIFIIVFSLLVRLRFKVHMQERVASALSRRLSRLGV